MPFFQSRALAFAPFSGNGGQSFAFLPPPLSILVGFGSFCTLSHAPFRLVPQGTNRGGVCRRNNASDYFSRSFRVPFSCIRAKGRVSAGPPSVRVVVVSPLRVPNASCTGALGRGGLGHPAAYAPLVSSALYSIVGPVGWHCCGGRDHLGVCCVGRSSAAR